MPRDPVKPPPYVKHPPNYKDIYVISVTNRAFDNSNDDGVDMDNVSLASHPPEYQEAMQHQQNTQTLNVVQLFQRQMPSSVRRQATPNDASAMCVIRTQCGAERHDELSLCGDENIQTIGAVESCLRQPNEVHDGNCELNVTDDTTTTDSSCCVMDDDVIILRSGSIQTVNSEVSDTNETALQSYEVL